MWLFLRKVSNITERMNLNIVTVDFKVWKVGPKVVGILIKKGENITV